MYRNMKDMKKIDNKKMTPKKLAACTLAATMAVTAVPANIPLVGREIVKADTLIPALGDEEYTLSLVNNIKDTTTFADVASKLDIKAVDSSNYIYWAKGATSVEITEGGNLVWNTDGDTPVSGKTKFEYGKTYTVTAEFKKTAKTASGATPTYDEGGLTPDSTGIVKVSDTVTFWPQNGMLKNVKDGSEYWFVDNTGAKDTSVDSLYQNSDGWYRVKAGVAKCSLGNDTLEENKYGVWFIDKTTGKVDFTKTGIVKIDSSVDIDDSVTEVDDGTYYVENGKVNTNKTGLVQEDGVWYNVVKGKVVDDAKSASVVKTPNGKWIYIGKDGKSNSTFTGIASNQYGTWYIDNGVVDFTAEGTVDITDATGAVAGGPGTGVTTYFLLGGKVQTDTTGIVFHEGTPYYVEKGVIGTANFDKKQLAFEPKWSNWIVLDEAGQPDNFNGLISNQYGTWYTDNNGVVDFNAVDLIEVDKDNEVVTPGTGDAVYYVKGGKVQTDKNGAIYESTIGQAFNVKAGKLAGLDIDKSVVKASNGKWYAIGDDGLPVQRLSGNAYGIWMPDPSGVVDFRECGFHVVSEDEAKLSGLNEGDIVYIKGGKLQKDVTGLVTLKDDTLNESANTGININDTVYVKNGVVCDDAGFKEPTVVLASDGKWYYVDEEGKVDSGFTGIAKNAYGTWYVTAGKVDFKATGFYTEDDKTYYFVNSKLATDKIGLVRAVTIGTSTDISYYIEKGVVTAKDTKDNLAQLSDGAWYYITDEGQIDPGFTGFAENKYGVWYVAKGRVDFTKTGIVKIDNSTVVSKSNKVDNLEDPSTIYVVNGKAQLDYTGFVVDGADKALFKKGQVVQNDDPELHLGTDNKWYYVQYGDADTTYTGLAKNEYGVWYVYKGVVSFNKTGVVETAAVEAAKLDDGKYYVANGKMDTGKTGIVKTGATSYYVQKGSVVTGIEADERVVNVDGAWYCINDEGEVFTPADNLAENKNGVWYIKDGKVDFTKKALVAVGGTNDSPALKNILSDTVYVSGGKFQDEATCVYVETVSGVTTRKYVKNGVVTTDDDKITVNKVVKGTDGKLYAVQPATDTNNAVLENGLAKNEDGEVVLIKDYLVNTTETKIYTVAADKGDDDVTGLSDTTDIAIINGVFAKDKTGIVKLGNDKVYVKKGVCTEADGSDTLVKVDDTYYLLGANSGDKAYKVLTNSGETIGIYNGDKYYVNGGVVRNVNRTNYDIGGTKYNIKDGKATEVTP